MKDLFLRLIRFYQRKISPFRPPSCKYYPTCSAYALTAIDRFGAFRGGLLALLRLARCRPWSDGGIDDARGNSLFSTVFPGRKPMKSPVSFLRLGLKNRSHRRKTKQNQAFMYNRALDLKADSYHRIFHDRHDRTN